MLISIANHITGNATTKAVIGALEQPITMLEVVLSAEFFEVN